MNRPAVYSNICYLTLTMRQLGNPWCAATVFVSHAWRYSFYDIVVDVMEQYAGEFPDAYFWFDLYTNNQNGMSTKDFECFSSTFRNSL